MLYVNFSVKCFKFAKNGHFSIFPLILVAIFVTIAMVKVKLIPDFYTWINVLINQYEKNGEKNNFYFLAS